MKPFHSKFAIFAFALLCFTFSTPTFANSGNPKSTVVYISDDRVEEFSINPIAYVSRHMDLQNLILQNRDKLSDIYLVTFKSSKGFLDVYATPEGKILKTHQRFANAYMPREVRNQIFKEYPGSKVTSFEHIATGNRNSIRREVYKIKLNQNGSQRTIKIRL